MTSHVRFVVGATVDLDDATAWYEARRPGLGKQLFASVKVAVSGFPYRIVYRSDAETITILAIAHERRSPGYWTDRSTV